jgi:hypothetical protein
MRHLMKSLTTITFVLLLSCNTSTSNKASNNIIPSQAADTTEAFQTFYAKFLHDTAFQKERTSEQLRSGTHQFTKIQSIYSLMYDKAFGHIFLTDTMDVGYTLKAEPRKVVETFFDEAGDGRSERNFQSVDNKWQLVKFDSVTWFRRN